jgi:hypothetical protein
MKNIEYILGCAGGAGRMSEPVGNDEKIAF